MVPNTAIAGLYVRMVGQDSLLALAQGNLLNNLDRIYKVRTHTFLAHNGQTAQGISRNEGATRYYAWEDTLIDCRNTPALIDSENMKNFDKILSGNPRFQKLKEKLEQRLDGLVEIIPFFTIMRAENNMRYNIRRTEHIEDFDMVRIGFKMVAKDEETFEKALTHLSKEGAFVFPAMKSARLHSIL